MACLCVISRFSLLYCKSLMYSGINKIAIITLRPYALLWNPRLYQILNWTICCSRSPLYLDHAIQDSTIIALYNVHAIFKWFGTDYSLCLTHGLYHSRHAPLSPMWSWLTPVDTCYRCWLRLPRWPWRKCGLNERRTKKDKKDIYLMKAWSNEHVNVNPYATGG